MASQVHVVGGGVIGLSSAWELSRNGHDVTIVAPAFGRDGAAWVAAGMLAPANEVEFGESALTALRLEAAARWPAFATALEEASGLTIGYDTTGTLTVALNASDRAAIDDLLAYQHSLGLTARRVSATECRSLVPALSPSLRGGIEVPGDHQVDNRALLAALVSAARVAGVTFLERRVVEVGPGPELVLADGCRLRPDHVVLAAGTGLSGLGAVPGLPEIRPVKGHILRLGPAPGAPSSPFLPRTVRGLVRGHSVYLVPRRDGTVVVGATVEERGAPWCRGRNRPLPQRDLARAAHSGRGGGPVGPPCRHAADRATIPGVTTLRLRVNGEPLEMEPGTTIADLVARLLEGGDAKGVAVAVDRCVVPRSEWASTPARAGSLVEVVSAAAGG
jgi:glycine oxidase